MRLTCFVVFFINKLLLFSMINMGINALKNSTKDAEDKIYKEIKKLVK